MNFLGTAREFLLEYLFPHSERVSMLLALSPAELLALPPAAPTGEESVIALFEYAHERVKELVWEVKYRGNAALAEQLGLVLYDTLVTELDEQNAFEKFGNILLVPVPSSAERRFERGWNQAELLARAIALGDRSGSLTHLSRLLTKIRHTESQIQTSKRKERLENLKHSMQVKDPRAVKDRCVVVVDDVVTTGATFAEARRALQEAGAKKVICLALAH